LQTLDVAILGGAFDPPHLGHLILAACSLKLCFSKEVWLMPSPDRPDKTMNRSLKERVHLAQRAISRLNSEYQKKVSVSLFEANLGTFRGSLHLMENLAKIFPHKKFGFILGQDALAQSRFWNDPVTGMMTGDAFLEKIPILSFERKVIAIGVVASSDHLLEQLPRLNSQSLCTSGLNDSVDIARSAFSEMLPQDFDYAALSSTRIREELKSKSFDSDFLRVALGHEILKNLK
jgi:nicotinic acid mononucleotide adenylyltransferase